MTKHIVLCADDYGQAPSVSRAIRTLINNGRVTATTCMVNSPYWSEHAGWLTPFIDHINIGLHINLTEGNALSQPFIDRYGESLMPLPILMRKIMLRQLDKDALFAECEAQLQQFTDKLQIPPAFIDGRQHIYQFPIIRQALLELYEKYLRSQKPYVRLMGGKVFPGTMIGGFKNLVMKTFATRPLQDLLSKHDIPYNASYAGIIPTDSVAEYRSLFLRCISEVSDGGIIVCHPGWYWPDAPDLSQKGSKARARQYEYLKGGQFLLDCHGYDITLKQLDTAEEVII